MIRPVVGLLLAFLPALAFADPILRWTHPGATDFTVRISQPNQLLNAGGSSLKSATFSAASARQADGTYRYDAAALVRTLNPGGYFAWISARDAARNRSTWVAVPISVGGGAMPPATDTEPPPAPGNVEVGDPPPPPPDPDPPTPPPPPPPVGPPLPSGDVVFADDFEDGTWSDTWDPTGYCCESDGQPGLTLAERNSVRCGGTGYGDQCAATSGARGGYWAHGPRMGDFEELYISWFTYYTDPWVPDPVGNKNMIVNDGAISMEAFVNSSVFANGKPTVILYGNGQSPCAAQSTPLNGEYSKCIIRYQNKGADLKIEPGNWYLFEWYCKLNAVGQTNGVTRLWVDKATPGTTLAAQTLRLEYADCTFRARDDQKLRQLWLSAYQNATSDPSLPQAPAGQTERWDRIVVSKSKVGPR